MTSDRDEYYTTTKVGRLMESGCVAADVREKAPIVYTYVLNCGLAGVRSPVETLRGCYGSFVLIHMRHCDKNVASAEQWCSSPFGTEAMLHS